MKIEESPRPAPDDAETWRRLLRAGPASPYLDPSETSPRQRHFDNLDWVECDTCAAKPGSPTLCNGCLANRNTIGRLKAGI